MAKKTAATTAERVAVVRLVLDGLAHGEPLDNVLRRLRPFADYGFPFPGDVLTEIAAEALDVAGATRATPLSLSDATERHLPERTVSGNTERQKHRAAFQAAIALHGGIVVDYGETAGWWQVDDYTFHAFDAAVVLIRVAAHRTGRSVRSDQHAGAAASHHRRTGGGPRSIAPPFSLASLGRGRCPIVRASRWSRAGMDRIRHPRWRARYRVALMQKLL